MTAAAFQKALDQLGWTHEVAAERLGAANRQRVGEWARGVRPLPDYIARHVETHLQLQQVSKGGAA